MAELINATDSLNEGRKKLNAIAKEMNDKDVASMPEIVNARNGKPSLKERLDGEHEKVTAQLAQKANKSDIGSPSQEQVDNWLERNPDATTTVQDRSLTEEKYELNSVTPQIASFVANDKKFTGDFVKDFGIIGTSGDETFMNREGRGSYIAKVEGGRTYIVNAKGGNVFRVGTSISYPRDGESPNWFSGATDSNKPKDGYTLTLADDEEYIIVFTTSDYLNYMSEDFTVKALDDSLERVKINLANGSVSANQTDFAKSHKNLIGDLVRGLSISGSSVEGYRFSETFENAGSYVTKLEGGRTYTVNVEGGDRFRIATSIGYPIDLERPHRLLGNLNNEPVKEYTFTLAEEEDYVVVYATIDFENRKPIHAKITEVHEVSDTVEINLAENSVSPDVLKKSKKNLIGRFVENFAAAGSSVEGVTFRNMEGRGSYITRLEGGRTYTVNVKGGSVFRVATSTSYPIAGESPNWFALIDGKKPKNGYTFTMPDDDNYAVIFVTSDYVNDMPEYAVLEEGYEIIDGVKINLAKGSVTPEMLSSDISTSISKAEIFIADMPDGFFDFGETDFEPQRQQPVDSLYGIYDALVQDFPEYVSREFRVNDESGLPIYVYRFRPNIPNNISRPPKIILNSTHSFEVDAVYANALFLDHVARNWENDPVCRMLRFNVDFVVVALANPYGFENGSRPNMNGVDINRNFPSNWVENEDADPGWGTHGPQPLSEVSSQELDKILQEHHDALFVIDHHNYGGDPYSVTGARLFWTMGTNELSDKITTGFGKMIGSKAMVDGYVPKDVNLGYVYKHDERTHDTGWFIHHVADYGFDGAILESMIVHEGITSSATVTRYNVDAIGNLVLSVLRYYNQ